MIGESFNSHDEDLNAPTGWEDLAASGGAETSAERKKWGSEIKKQELEDFSRERLELRKMYNGNIPQGISDALNEHSEKLKAEIKDIQTSEAIFGMSQERANEFRKYAETVESAFDFDEIVDGIHKYREGETIEAIKDEVLLRDRGLGDEGNRKMGEVVFRRLEHFLDGYSED
ncbi:hypothetical protein IKF67_02735 [Candidatus Saccharibacteria bacterium]|nr:hypothetical protein [Candidatus Saccharibacteria bacterium]